MTTITLTDIRRGRLAEIADRDPGKHRPTTRTALRIPKGVKQARKELAARALIAEHQMVYLSEYKMLATRDDGNEDYPYQTGWPDGFHYHRSSRLRPATPADVIGHPYWSDFL